MPSPARWPTIRRSCWPTSRPAISTRPPAATSWTCCSTCAAPRSSTLVLVTHDAELAALADTRLVLRDGRPVIRTTPFGTRQSRTRRRCDDLRPPDGAARDSRLLAAPAVLLRLHRRRRGLDRGHPLGDPERPRRADPRSARADRRRRRRHAAIAPFGEKVRDVSSRQRRAAASPIVSEAIEIADDGPAGERDDRRGWSSCAPSRPRFRSTARMTLRTGAYSHALLRDRGALVRPELLAQLNLRVGDDLLIGTQRVRDSRRDRERARPQLWARSRSGSRVLIDYADLPSTGLLSFGSRASHQLLLQVPDRAGPGRRRCHTLLAAICRRVRQRIRGRPVVSARTRTGWART